MRAYDVVTCAACGLYYMAELAEEYPTLTKKIIKVSILVRYAHIA